MSVNPNDVFTPGYFPKHTYVERDNSVYENRLRESLSRKGTLTLISGPSKSGKTVLVENVIDPKDIVIVSGSDIKVGEDLWRHVLSKLGVGLKHKATSEKSVRSGSGSKIGGKAKIPFLGEASVEIAPAIENQRTNGEEIDYAPAGKEEALKALSDAGKVLVIDDFHYIPEETQQIIAQQLKDAVRKSAKIVVLLVPHRAEDPLRANPDLRGRILEIAIEYWKEENLVEIAKKGFPLVDIKASESDIRTLAKEALGSPQLMQLLCLEACSELKALNGDVLKGDAIISSAKRAVQSTNARTIVQTLKTGPASHGTERTLYNLSQGGTGDNYQILLEAIKRDPPQTKFSFEEIRNRAQSVIRSGEANPQRQQLTTSMQKWNDILEEREPPDRVIEWRDDPGELYIIDPYFLFYLRWHN
jgi:hypothetical protein